MFAFCGRPSHSNAPYGWLSTLTRTSSLTTSCWFFSVLGRDLQRAHAIRLEPHRELERVRRHHLEVVGVIEARRSVQRAAVLVDDADVLELADVLRALEHHVLEQVREPGAVLRLDAEPDAVHHLDDHDRRGVVLADHHAQAVRQLAVDDRHRESRLPSRRGACADGDAA